MTGDDEVSFMNTVTLNCNAKAAPAPEIIWLRRSEGVLTLLLNTARTSISTQYNPTNATATSVLVIRRAQHTDQGDYLCEARNNFTASPAVSMITVRVLGKKVKL